MTTPKRLTLTYFALTAGLLVLFGMNLLWGSVSLTPRAVLAALLGKGQDALSMGIILQLRLPRAVMVILLGAALSAAGYLLQTFFANPIAGPFVMGISSGAKLAVALTMVMFLNQGRFTSSAALIIAAFAGAMAAMAFVLAVARRVQRMSILVICGVMIGYICSAITDIVVTFAQDSNIVNLHGQLFGRYLGQCAGGGLRGAARAGSLVLPLQAHGGLPAGGKLRQKRGRGGAAIQHGAGASFQPAGGLRHGLCRADLLCGHRGAPPCQGGTGQRQTLARPAGLRAGRGGVLPAL